MYAIYIYIYVGLLLIFERSNPYQETPQTTWLALPFSCAHHNVCFTLWVLCTWPRSLPMSTLKTSCHLEVVFFKAAIISGIYLLVKCGHARRHISFVYVCISIFHKMSHLASRSWRWRSLQVANGARPGPGRMASGRPKVPPCLERIGHIDPWLIQSHLLLHRLDQYKGKLNKESF